MATKRSVGDLKEADLKGKRVFVRVDLNVPLDDNFNITDDTRIRAAVPTIKYLMGHGAIVILSSHLGRPKGVTPKYSLKPLVPRLSELLGIEVKMANDCIGPEVEKMVAEISEGGVLLRSTLAPGRGGLGETTSVDSPSLNSIVRFLPTSSSMASINSITTPQTFLPLPNPKTKPTIFKNFSTSSLRTFPTQTFSGSKWKKNNWVVVNSVAEELDVIPVQSSDSTDQQDGVVVTRIEREGEVDELGSQVSQQVGGFSSEGRFSFEGAGEIQGFSSSGGSSGENGESQDLDRLIDRVINATIVLAAGCFAITKLLTIDQDYWHGWTIYEIVRYAPQHNWIAYEEALKTNPVLAKMVISGVVYSVGDWIAQCYEGKPLFEFDRARMFRSGLVGFTLHGSLSHYYYQFCEELFPFQDWWVVPVKVAFDQTAWSAVWNSIYFVILGFLRLENPVSIFNEWKATFFPMLTAGWKLWPFAHLITYGVVPVEQRLLWVDCVELIWVTILSTYSNEKSEARISEAPEEVNSSSASIGPPEE